MGDVISSWNGDGECVRGESLTHHTNKMKLFNVIAAAAVIGTSLISARPVKAGCFPPLAANIIVPIIRETGDHNLALWEAYQAGFFEPTQGCNARTISYVKEYWTVIH